MVEKVKELLRSVGASHLYPKLEELGVDEYSFFHLTPSDLSLIGIKDEQQQALLLQLISKQQRQQSPYSSDIPSTNYHSNNNVGGGMDKLGFSSPTKQVKKNKADRFSLLPKALGSEDNLDSVTRKNSKHRHSCSVPNWKKVMNEMEQPNGTTEEVSSRIVVCVRKRPLSKKERSKNDADVISTVNNTLQVFEPKLKVDLTKYTEVHEFSFDKIFNEESNNMTVYKSCAQPLVFAFFKGCKVTCFAYGQTGAGKTYTMMGTNEEPGLYALALEDIFRLKAKPEYSHLGVYISFFEIYGAKLFDLLNGRKRIECREDAKQRVRIIGLEQRFCTSVQDVFEILEQGAQARSTGSTGANADSSRSHAILQIVLKYNEDGMKNEEDPDYTFGKLSFIDLAGSERAADTTHSDRQTRMEGAEINKSLLALKECIRALDQNQHHTPFRGSKLTLVLKDSFVSVDSRTVMIANVSPSASNCEHTLNTLRYADRVKELRKDSSGSRRQSCVFSASSMDSNQGHEEEAYEEEHKKQQQEEETTTNIPKKKVGKDHLSMDHHQGVVTRSASRGNEDQTSSSSSWRQKREISKSLIPPLTKKLLKEDDSRAVENGSLAMTDNNNNNNNNNRSTRSSRLSMIPKPSFHRRKSISSYMTEDHSKGFSSVDRANYEEGIGRPPSLIHSQHSQASMTSTETRSQSKQSKELASHLPHALASCNNHSMNDHPLSRRHSLLLSSSSQPPSVIDKTDIEENLVMAHRQHIDDTMELVKQEMALLQMVDHPNSCFEEYVDKLGLQLEKKLKGIRMLRDKLLDYRNAMK
ncbi:hypothetical protein GAYE_SCF31G4898 [Galdieria yellowstonensis]|uniref:Kinesin-like protein n=1 Tax=Galdieria yellowstonensis TaxID=3028027 RepID=A0AAV9IHN8_9RHOD|nr:hypothetical protein GAYE_SCF31G4898 [Galdieria yellowstonensis]